MVVIEKVSQLQQKVRDSLREALIENSRKSNFIRIYPTRSSDIYDKFFS
jgi:ABC-type Fe3+/spermidine/putrescine transport system ATPase subunit